VENKGLSHENYSSGEFKSFRTTPRTHPVNDYFITCIRRSLYQWQVFEANWSFRQNKMAVKDFHNLWSPFWPLMKLNNFWDCSKIIINA